MGAGAPAQGEVQHAAAGGGPGGERGASGSGRRRRAPFRGHVRPGQSDRARRHRAGVQVHQPAHLHPSGGDGRGRHAHAVEPGRRPADLPGQGRLVENHPQARRRGPHDHRPVAQRRAGRRLIGAADQVQGRATDRRDALAHDPALRAPRPSSLRSAAMLHRGLVMAVALAGALLTATAGVRAFDESKYPDWSGQWRGRGNQWDPTKPAGRGQQPPLTPEYEAIFAASLADQKACGPGTDTRYTCLPPGMPRMMTAVFPMEFVFTPAVTFILFENMMPRRIFTDGRDWPAEVEPAYAGYSI